MKISEVKINCESCKATGIYSGYAEPEGTAVICKDCGGRGFKVATLFNYRKTDNNIKIIKLSDGGQLSYPEHFKAFID